MRRSNIAGFALLCMLFGARLDGGELIYSYGFENWDTDIETTGDWPFTSTWPEFCENHETSTEVVTSYQGVGEANWMPHSGNYFFLRNNSSHALNPSVPGITAGYVSDSAHIGFNGNGCNWSGTDSDLEIYPDITSGEIFIRFWARTSEGFDDVAEAPEGRCKWTNIDGRTASGARDGTIYFLLSTRHDNDDPRLYFYNQTERYMPSENYVVCENAWDGNWHKWSYYVNYNTGIIRCWYDVETETSSNATKEFIAPDGAIASQSRPDAFTIQGNFSADHPVGISYHALDDLEIWDGMPDESGDTTAPDPPENVDATAVP